MKESGSKKVKCVVWDLDNTLWEGVLLEESSVRLRPGVVEIIRELDRRGILQSVASKNDHALAMAKLREFGLDEYFLYPQINWNPKSGSIRRIAESINIGIDTLAFIDDQPFEREEVSHFHPAVLCLDAADLSGLLAMPQMTPRFVTEDSRLRRQMYLNDMVRNEAEQQFEGTSEEFLSSLGMIFTIAPVGALDLQRAEELTVRTNQLNATGYTYSYEELDRFRQSADHLLLIAGLEDKYGSYGKIGLALVERGETVWRLKLLLMSCRVMSRGVGTLMLNHIMRMAKETGARLQAEFVPTDRNRLMYVTYKFAGFTEIGEEDGLTLLENDLSQVPDMPEYVEFRVLQSQSRQSL